MCKKHLIFFECLVFLRTEYKIKMKKTLQYILLSILSFGLLGCEKDDICAEEDPKTQAVVLEFYNKDRPTEAKTPANLVAYVTGNDLAIAAVGNKLSLPLMIDSQTTTWNLVLNANDANDTNDIIDQVTFNYDVIQEYVSRSCGYKANFILNETNGVLTTNNWINSIEIINSNIVNPNEIHIKIFF